LAALAPVTVKSRDPFYKKYGAVITIFYLGIYITYIKLAGHLF